MTTKKRARDACHIRVQFAKLYLENGFLIFFPPRMQTVFWFWTLRLTDIFFPPFWQSQLQQRECEVFFFFSTHQETEAANPYAARFPLWSLCDNRAIINHTGWLFTCPLFPLVDRRLSFSSSWASSSRMKNVWKDWISSSCWSFLCSYFTVESLGFMYHTVCSRRLDKDYTSYIPCSRYIGTCVSVEYVYVNIWRFWFFSLLNGSIFEVYTFRDHP